MGKTRKTLLVMTIVVAFATALGLAACGGSSGSSSAASASGSESASASAASASAAAEASLASSTASAASASSSSAAGADATLTADDLANVDIEIALDDFDAMYALSKDIQNGRATGKVVKIDGYVLNFAKGMSYNIVEKSADGKERHGTVFVIEGVEEDVYPSDGTHVILTGKVVANDSLSFNIHTLPEFVEVVE